MTESVFHGCTETCGWMAAVMSVLCWGTYGVLLKTNATVEVDPLVMQTYKSITVFATCWIVVLLGEEIKWSYWGIASGLFWVPGATAGIFGIRNAGLAVAVGTWSAIGVLTSFIFGIIIFQERVKNMARACFAFLFLIVGLIGMSKYSATDDNDEKVVPLLGADGQQILVPQDLEFSEDEKRGGTAVLNKKSGGAPSDGLLSNRQVKKNRQLSSDNINNIVDNAASSAVVVNSGHRSPLVVPKTTPVPPAPPSSSGLIPLEMELAGAASNNNNNIERGDSSDDETGALLMDDESERRTKCRTEYKNGRVVLCGGRLALTRRQMGIIGAVINGAWGGMQLVPLHYALRDDGLTGAGFLISFAGGSMIVNVSAWIGLLGYYLYVKKGRVTAALECLPKFYCDQLGVPGFTAGILYAAGNFGSILSVTYLGQSTGFSFSQMQLFVSGLWGVFYFHEIKKPDVIFKWFIAATISVFSIIWLSYEHEGDTPSHR